jgi:hypothetical protein
MRCCRCCSCMKWGGGRRQGAWPGLLPAQRAAQTRHCRHSRAQWRRQAHPPRALHPLVSLRRQWGPEVGCAWRWRSWEAARRQSGAMSRHQLCGGCGGRPPPGCPPGCREAVAGGWWAVVGARPGAATGAACCCCCCWGGPHSGHQCRHHSQPCNARLRAPSRPELLRPLQWRWREDVQVSAAAAPSCWPSHREPRRQELPPKPPLNPD